jgi:DNA mismatch endonuclease (patch repair protein)
MTDTHSPSVRSYNMSCIRSKNTKPEELVRKYLFSRRLRYRKNDKRYPGKPDIVFPMYRIVVFVHGCFWHGHEDCSDFVVPKTNLDYWLPKLKHNKKRDDKHVAELQARNWRVITIWECELKKPVRDERLARLYNEITSNYYSID